MISMPQTEKHLSQIPALQLLAGCGYSVMSPADALSERQGRAGNVLLEDTLRRQLVRLNRIRHKGAEYYFSEANIQEAIQKLKNLRYDGLLKSNAEISDLLIFGTTLEQTIEGSSKSFNLNYIDWHTPANNVFHAVPEFVVERHRSSETVRPDIVLFVNGIPLAVIECKAPQVEVEQAISQSIRNQGEEYIPKLFTYAQLLLAVNKNSARFATVGAAAKFWHVWRELEDSEADVAAAVNKPLSAEHQAALFSGALASARTSFQQQEQAGERLPTEQDRALYSLCRPQRLLELIHGFTLFDNGIKKIARYQQFFVVRSTMARIQRRSAEGNRAGGVIWHTQGSGKSLTMAMLAKALALSQAITNPRLVLVTDREDLDKQLGGTFRDCGLSQERATSGRNLVEHLRNKVNIITTLIHKFEASWNAEKFSDQSPDVFVLVDESHRTNLDSLHNAMKRVLPNACYLGFSGTPLLKKRKVKGLEKNTFSQFGHLINPHYSIRQAVLDKAVLPLLYEGRHVEMLQNQAAIDLWFERHTADLTRAQQADLKKKYARAEMLNKADQVIYMRAFDISEHYRATWQGTGFKAQLVAPSKVAALRYHECLQDIGSVSSEVVISAPDAREGFEEVDDGPSDAVGKFWSKMMKRYGNEEQYLKSVIGQFKDGDDPEILIVVDKLLTGFDAPRNTVLYLCRALREHTLLQAIARVNRLHEDKEFGYIIDYASILGELDTALTMYDAFEGFDEEDLVGTLAPVSDEVARLPQRHSDLWDIFRPIANKHDAEAFEALLADDELREEFYERLAEYSKTLGIALSTDKFVMDTDAAKLQGYKADLKRFQKLKQAVKLRYAEVIDYRDYEPKIKKLLDTHIQANEVTQLNAPVDIFDQHSFDAVKQGQGIHASRSTAAKADSIAHATKKVINVKMDEDPAFYEKFSRLIQQAIDDFRAQRISDLDYLSKICSIRDAVVSKERDDVPAAIRENDEACAYYGMAKKYFAEAGMSVQEEGVAYMAQSFQQAFAHEQVVDFWNNANAINKVKGRMDDYFYDELKGKQGIDLNSEQMDEIIARTMRIAKSRF